MTVIPLRLDRAKAGTEHRNNLWKNVNHVLEPGMTGEKEKNWGLSGCLLQSDKIVTQKESGVCLPFAFRYLKGLMEKPRMR